MKYSKNQLLCILHFMNLGCSKSGLGVYQQDAHLIITVSHCNASDVPIRVYDINVYRMTKGDKTLVCSLSSGDRFDRSLALDSWEYGATPAGFILGPCEQLENKQAYSVEFRGSISPEPLQFETEAQVLTSRFIENCGM